MKQIRCMKMKRAIQKLVGESSSKYDEVRIKAEESYRTLQAIKIQVNQRPLSTQFIIFYVPFITACLQKFL